MNDRVDCDPHYRLHLFVASFPGAALRPPPYESRTDTIMSALRVLVVDDHESVRKGVCAILSSRPDLELCGEAVDGEDAINKAALLRPDIVIMDISMPGMDGMSAAREIRKLHPEIATIILSMHDSRQLIESARKVGIKGYVTKGQAGSILLDAVDSVAKGESFFPQ